MRAAKQLNKQPPIRPDSPPSVWRERFSAAALCLLTLLIYIPTYKAGFIWDDDVLAGNALHSQGWQGLRDIWFSLKFGDYVPITATTFWVEWQIHGGMKEIQHATNIVLQALNVVLLWRVLLHLKIRGAWLVAAVFAVHPVCVASVTWLAERKNTLSMFFYLLGLLCFLRSVATVESKAPSRQTSPRFGANPGRDYFLSFVFFLLALLSKSSAVVLPVVMLLCLWWRTGRMDRRELPRVAPFFVFALILGVVTLVGHHLYAPKNTTGDDWLVRSLTATRAVWFYLEKDLLPVGLTLHYPRWKIEPSSALNYLPGLALLGMFILFWRFRQSWGRACLFGFGYYIVALGPALGFLNMAFLSMGQVADHFQYLALPGIIALLVGGAFHFFQRLPEKFIPATSSFFSVLVLASLASLSWQHQRLMANPEALWEDNIKKNPDSWVAQNNYGGILAARGQFEAAIPFYQEALKKQTELPTVEKNLGRALVSAGKPEEAVGHYLESIRLKPDDLKTRNDLGIVYMELGKTNEAISCFETAVEGDPVNATFLSNLLQLLVLNGEKKRANEVSQTWLQRAPTSSVANKNMGQLLLENGKLEGAVFHYKEAVRLNPDFVEARSALDALLAQQQNHPTNRPPSR